MTSKKIEHRQWIYDHFDNHTQSLTKEELRVFAMWCVIKIGELMPLYALKEWREKLENKQ